MPHAEDGGDDEVQTAGLRGDDMAHEGEAATTAKVDPGPAQLPIEFPLTAASHGNAGETLCPFHVAMQELAEAAVCQLVYYAEGEYAPRPGLLRELDRWQQAHV